MLLKHKCDLRDLNPGYRLGKAMSYQARLRSRINVFMSKFLKTLLIFKAQS